MYVSRSDWRELVERLDHMEMRAREAERSRNENGYLAQKYADELARAQAKASILAEAAAKYQGKYEDLRMEIMAVLDLS